MLDSTRSRPHGPPKPRSLERTHTDAWRTTSDNTLPYPPLRRDPPIHSKRHLGAGPFHRSGCLGADPSRIGGVLQPILRQARRLGSAGFLLAFIGGANRPGELLVVGTVIGPLLATQAPSLLDPAGALYGPLLLTVGLITLTYGLGFFLLAIATLRSAIVPRTPIVPRLSLWMVILAIPLALGFFIFFIIGSIAGLIFSLGLIGWGYGLWLNQMSMPTDSVR